MELEQFEELFQKNHNLKFKDIENKLSPIPQLHAFLLLQQLVPSKTNIIATAEHDVIYLDFTPNELKDIITEEQIIELVACRVDYDSYNDYLTMRV